MKKLQKLTLKEVGEQLPVIGSQEALCFLGGTGSDWISPSEMELMMDNGTWTGGFVEGIGYVGSDNTVVGSLISESDVNDEWWNDIDEGTSYGWNWSSETSKTDMGHEDALDHIYESEDMYRNASSTSNYATFVVGGAAGYANAALGTAVAAAGLAVGETFGTIADAYNSLGRLYNELDTNGIRKVTRTTRVTTPGTGMYVSTSVTTYYLPDGTILFEIHH